MSVVRDILILKPSCSEYNITVRNVSEIDFMMESLSPAFTLPQWAHFTAVFTGNGAVHEHAEPQPRASRRLRAHDQALLWLQGLQQGRWQQQGHQAGCQEEVVPHTHVSSFCLKKLELCHGRKIFKCHFFFFSGSIVQFSLLIDVLSTS